MTSPSAERKAAQIADDFLDAEMDSAAEAKAWLVEKITAALEEAYEAWYDAGYKEAMRKRF
jgi:flagellar biosynthesis/type III secretory pathway protein FliH